MNTALDLIIYFSNLLLFALAQKLIS